MYIVLIILGCLLWLGAIYTLSSRIVLSAPLSFLALLCISLARRDGVDLLPLNSTLLIGWLCMTLVVTALTAMQPAAVAAQRRGMSYITVGAIAGMAVGLLGVSMTGSLALRYAIMVVGTIAGVFLGFLLYTRTPQGTPVSLSSGNFFSYLLAKGFPAAITVMQLGVVLVIALALYNIAPQ